MRIKNLGIMQGRLSPQVGNKIQYFPWKTWKKEFSFAKKLKIKSIEWTLDYNRLSENPLLTKVGQKQITNIKKKYNIKCNSVTADCFMQKPFWKLKKNKKILNLFETVIRSCFKLNIKILILPLVDNGKLDNKLNETKFVSLMNSYSDFLKKNKLKIAFESDYPPSKLKRFIRKFDKNIFGINYDLGNSSHFGYDIRKEFECYSDRIINIHIKDRLFKSHTVRLGDGNADFQNFFKLLDQMNYKKNLILQVARSKKKNDFFTEIVKNISFLESVKKKLYE